MTEWNGRTANLSNSTAALRLNDGCIGLRCKPFLNLHSHLEIARLARDAVTQ